MSSRSISKLDADVVAQLLSAIADLAMIVDDEGIIRDLAFGSKDLATEFQGSWLGRPWIETVTIESRPKVEAMLRDARSKVATRWRHVNYPAESGNDVPVLCSAVRVGVERHLVVIGRDLRDLAQLQQRLVKAQQAMERDYARARSADTRYRVLFHVASEAVLIMDARSRKVLEANPAAGRLLGHDPAQMVGRDFQSLLDAENQAAVDALLSGTRAGNREDDVQARSASGQQEFLVSAALFRQDSKPMLLVRLMAARGGGAGEVLARIEPNAQSTSLTLIERSPDGFVVTDPSGAIMSANSAFLDLAGLALEEQARGRSLDRWLGRPGVDLKVMLTNLRQHGTIRLFATTIRCEYGTAIEVEISGVSAADAEVPCLGFTIRPMARRLAADLKQVKTLPHSVDQLTDLVGRATLKELVSEATDVIERLCIEAALRITKDNRASAAEILGLSRQSLYVKMRRHGLGDLGGDRKV